MMILSIVIFGLTSPLPCMLSDITQSDLEPVSNTQPDLTRTSDMVDYVHLATLQACGNLGLFPKRVILLDASIYCWNAFDTLHKLGGKFEDPECRYFFGDAACRRRGPFGTYKCTVPVRRNRFRRVPYLGDYLGFSRVEATTLTDCARPIINLSQKPDRKEKDVKREKKKLERKNIAPPGKI